jgi:hypothetical protein
MFSVNNKVPETAGGHPSPPPIGLLPAAYALGAPAGFFLPGIDGRLFFGYYTVWTVQRSDAA